MAPTEQLCGEFCLRIEFDRRFYSAVIKLMLFNTSLVYLNAPEQWFSFSDHIFEAF